MDGTKGKATSPSIGHARAATTSMIDLGSTPPWTLPATYHEESAMRSTQSSPVKTVTPRHVFHSQDNPLSTNLASWSALNKPLKTVAVPQGRPKVEQQPLFSEQPRVVSAHETVDGDHSDYEDDDDGVYMINAKEGSWSGPLESEENPEVRAKLPFQAEVALKHLKRAQEIDEQRQRQEMSKVASSALQLDDHCMCLTPNDKQKWQKDLLLRQTIRQIKRELKAGAVLTLERLDPVNRAATCDHPLCPAPDARISLGAYYFILSRPSQPRSDDPRYCLFCLEALWNGKDMAEPLLDAQVISKQDEVHQVPIFGLDGSMDDMRLAAAGILPAPITPSSMTSTPSSTSRPCSSRTASTPATLYSDSEQRTVAMPNSLLTLTDCLPDSPLSRKSTKVPHDAVEEHDVASNDRQDSAGTVKNATTRKLNQLRAHRIESLRRSSRLQSVTPHDPNVSAIGKGVLTNPPTDNEPELPTTKATEHVSTETIAEEVRKADARLEVMYGEREKALTQLSAGENKVIKHPNGVVAKSPRSVSKDLFGVVYTDLLAEGVKYWTKSTPLELARSANGAEASSGIVGPMPEKLRSTHHLNSDEQMERWCFCRKSENGREMIECEDERCLIGWYHVDCVGDHVGQAEAWLCELCRSQIDVEGLAPMSCRAVEALHALFAPSSENRCGTLPSCEALMQPIQPRTALIEATRDDLDLPQLDGAADHLILPHQPPKPSPLSQSPLQVPASLLASKHAPRDKELLASQCTVPTATPEQQPMDLPETPGSRVSSLSSTTSTGQWRVPPTRFQHLASYIVPGNSLSDSERAAVELWKTASKEQSDWEDFVADCNKLRAEYAYLLGDSDDSEESSAIKMLLGVHVGRTNGEEPGDRKNLGNDFEDEVTGNCLEGAVRSGAEQSDEKSEDEMDKVLKDLMAQAGLSRKQCFSRNLSGVLAEIRCREAR